MAVAAFAVVEAIRILVSHSGPVLYGDQALLDLGARRAVHLDQLVGPYSRAGFHQPGPAVFYVLAPFVGALEPSSAGLYLGAVVVNAVALMAAVAVVWRRFGPLAALWAAAVIDLYGLSIGIGTLREPWNPYLIVAPMVLFVCLWAIATLGTSGAAVWAAVVGSYVVQTHLAAAPFVVVVMAALMAWLAWSWWRRRGDGGRAGRRWGPARVTGGLALVLIWLPPLVELGRDQPNNLQLLWDFFTSAHVTTPWREALRVAANAATILPFGYHDYVLTLNRTGAELGAGAAVMALGLAAALWLGWRRHQPASVALAAAGGLGFVIGTASLTDTAGPAYLYFAVWISFVPVAFLLAIGLALFAPGASRPARQGRRPWMGAKMLIGPGRVGPAALVAVTILVAALTVRSDLRMGSIAATTGSGPWPPTATGAPQGKVQTIDETVGLARAAASFLRPGDRWVNITIGTPALWPYAAGLVVALDERGIQSTVAPASWELYFGHERAPDRPVQATFDLYASSDPNAPLPAAATTIADFDGVVLTYRRA